MSVSKRTIEAAYWMRPGQGCVLLSRNWKKKAVPVVRLIGGKHKLRDLRPMEPAELARFTGYYEKDGKIVFCLNPRRYPHVDFDHDPVRVAGPFNDWGRSEDGADFSLRPGKTAAGKALYEVAIDRDRIISSGKRMTFKFVTQSWHWLTPLRCAPNVAEDKTGNLNYTLRASRTGAHAFFFELADEGRGMDEALQISLGKGEPVPILPGLFFYDLESELPLGARIERGNTAFRLFAPRARKVRLEISDTGEAASWQRFDLMLNDDQVTWEVVIEGKLHGWFYRYFVDGPDDGLTTHFDFKRPLLDPWARATCGPEGPGIVIEAAQFPKVRRRHDPPAWEDLSILECHVRDIVHRAPVALTDDERQGFSGITKFLQDKQSYLRTLGVNTLEFQPIQQFDSTTADEYHWGYMTNAYFAPCAWYGSDPKKAAQNSELKQMVAACHDKDLSVLIDVVYNHVGEPPNLLYIDKAYYFHLNEGGHLMNWSGCGNTLRAESANATRLIIESLVHLVEHYDIDGFRFDLAELISIEILKLIGDALRAVKPSIILIAEPWSFRGSIQWDARMAGFAFWNDGFREFGREYVKGHSNSDALTYFAKGSLDHMAAWPSQSINYVESHDDRCFLDDITENENHNGEHPTHNDRLRCHMMAALLYCSVGVPLLSAGQDFMRSKRGLNNTYQNGEVNALDYHRIQHFGQTHDYFHQWISFRLSEWGQVLRLHENPGEGYLRLFKCEHGERSAAALLFNADRALGPKQILLALNPHFDEQKIHLYDIDGDGWKELADIHNFNFDGIFNGRLNHEHRDIHLGPMDLGLWVRE